MTKRSIILAACAIVLFIAALVSVFMEKQQVINDIEDPDVEPEEDLNETDKEESDESGDKEEI